MQAPRRTQQDRTLATRAALLAAGRKLFVEKGFSETSTPELVAATGMTRGALYHHYADKRALFAAVIEREAEAVATEIEQQSVTGSAVEMLLAGSRAYLEAMAKPGRTRLLLVDGPATLGQAEMDRIDALHGGRTLREGLAHAMHAKEIARLPLSPLASMLGAMFDRAALSIDQGEKLADSLKVMEAVIDGLRL